MIENDQEVAQLKEQIRKFVNDSTRYSVGPSTFQRLVELDPEGASAVAANCQEIQERAIRAR